MPPPTDSDIVRTCTRIAERFCRLSEFKIEMADIRNECYLRCRGLRDVRLLEKWAYYSALRFITAHRLGLPKSFVITPLFDCDNDSFESLDTTTINKLIEQEEVQFCISAAKLTAKQLAIIKGIFWDGKSSDSFDVTRAGVYYILNKALHKIRRVFRQRNSN